MFITVTVETNRPKKKAIKKRRQNVHVTGMWRKAVAKKRGFWQRVKGYKKSLGAGLNNLDGQGAMF